MRILALERESSAPGEAFAPYLEAEARRIWELYQAGSLRAISFRLEEPLAVLELECDDLGEAEELLAGLPLVEQGLIEFELIPLRPYPGLARLFDAAASGGQGESS
jgi:hypothetical protein